MITATVAVHTVIGEIDIRFEIQTTTAPESEKALMLVIRQAIFDAVLLDASRATGRCQIPKGHALLS